MEKVRRNEFGYMESEEFRELFFRYGIRVRPMADVYVKHIIGNDMKMFDF